MHLLTLPPIVGTVFPKSGTNLLAQMLVPLGPCPRYPNRFRSGAVLATHDHGGWGPAWRNTGGVIGDIDLMMPGDVCVGHLAASRPFVKWSLDAIDAVIIFMRRDLRDVAVSEAHFVERTDGSARFHPFADRLMSLGSHRERIVAVIEGRVEWGMPALAERFREYEPWLSCDDVLSITYEDAISNPTGTAQFIVDHVERQTGSSLRAAMSVEMAATVSPFNSPTFRAGRVRDWEAEFDSSLVFLAEQEGLA